VQIKQEGRDAMMSQHEQSSSTYGRYEEQQAYVQQGHETPYRQISKGETVDDDFVDAVSERIVQRLRQETAGKVYPQPQQIDKNILRMVMAVISMLILVLFAFLFVIVVGGSTGWISFAIGSFIIFLIVAVVIDKVK
jgi:Fe2+ transport system protein B